MRKPYNITINQQRNTVTMPNIEFVTNDYMTCSLAFKIMKDDLEALDLAGNKVYLVVKTPSNKSVQERCTVNDAKAGISNILLSQDLIIEQGLHQAELQVVDAENNIVRMTSPRFSYNVRLSLENTETEEAKNKLSQLQEALEQAANLDGKIKTHNEDEKSHPGLVSQLNDIATDVDTHKTNKVNPHGVTKAQVGLSNVPNLNMVDFGLSTGNGSYSGDLKDMVTTRLFCSQESSPLSWPSVLGTYPMGIHFNRSAAVQSQLALGFIGGMGYRVKVDGAVWSPWRVVYDNSNTIVDANGFIKEV